MNKAFHCLTICFALALCGQASAVTNLLVNPGYLDNAPIDGAFGDGWASFGAVGFNQFFGAGNPHASLFGDNGPNVGGYYQQGIVGSAGTTYQFDLMNTRIESNWDADLEFGIEFYAADDTTKLGETRVPVDAATRLALPNVDGGGAANGAVFSMQATAPAGTAFARPIVEFDNVNFGYVNEPQANIFVFNTHLSEVPAPGGELLKNPGFEDEDSQGSLGDFWGNFGNSGFNDFFSGGGPANGHASLFADTPGNSGSVYQQSILGTAGTSYEFILTDVRIESNFDADLSFGLEFYSDDDFTKLGETIELIDTSTTGDGLSFVMQGTAPVGTTYVRPIVSFDNVVSTATTDESVFIFDASLVELTTTFDPADLNMDGFVDGLDLGILLGNWNQNVSPSGGELNGIQPVDGLDLGILLGAWNPPPPAAAAVPEPTSLMLLGLGGLILASRWRS